MADNGSAGSIFHDRRGENPFQPMVPTGSKPMVPTGMQTVSMAQQQAPHSIPSITSFGGDSYLGQGASIPNGALPPRAINGKSYTRDNPDAANVQRRRIDIGERSTL